MGKNKHKIAFIICVSDDFFFKECCLYINQLVLPIGFVTEIVPIYNPKSMAAGYNIGMAQTDAKYKVYMHEDVFLINPHFLVDIMKIFSLNRKIGMIGVVGTPVMPASGVQSHGRRVGNLYSVSPENCDFNGYNYEKEDGYLEVQAIDGMLMVTRDDVPWREDLFDGWDFYDSSQSFEFTRRGYKIVVPEQKKPWCAHEESGFSGMWSFDKYRQIFIKEYLGN